MRSFMRPVTKKPTSRCPESFWGARREEESLPRLCCVGGCGKDPPVTGMTESR